MPELFVQLPGDFTDRRIKNKRSKEKESSSRLITNFPGSLVPDLFSFPKNSEVLVVETFRASKGLKPVLTILPVPYARKRQYGRRQQSIGSY